MKCVICKQSSWEKVDQYRIKPQGMSLCTSCGFISYPEKYKTKEQVIEYYRKEYRGTPPKINNLFTGQTKLHYHEHFLRDLVQTWIVAGKQDPVICDTGAAYGLFLAWWRNVKNKDGAPAFPKAELLGTELTTSFRRVAYHEYGLSLSEEFDTSKKYDFISSYKVAEHIYGIDEELVRYRDALKEDGILYISVPTWFDRAHNFGMQGFDIEYYYHPDHCNVWTRGHFEKLLTETGFQILKADHDVYDSTYLCIVAAEGRDIIAPIAAPTVDWVRKALQRIYQANELCNKRQYEQAVEVWPNFPIARRAAYENRRAEWHKRGFEGIREGVIKPWLAIDPFSAEALLFSADLALRYKQFNEAEEYCKRGIVNQPPREMFFTMLANIYRTAAKEAPTIEKKYQYLADARECAKMIKTHFLAGFQNAVTWIYNDHAQLPMPGE